MVVVWWHRGRIRIMIVLRVQFSDVEWKLVGLSCLPGGIFIGFAMQGNVNGWWSSWSNIEVFLKSTDPA